MTRPFTTAEILEAYTHHPLSYTSIMERLTRSRPQEGLPVSELDLAVDPAEGVTDQNHIGGALSTLRLAARAQITGNDKVLDLGCGIGGPARLLAAVYGCEVQGVDANVNRVREAEQLSRLVAMDRLTTFKAVDFLNASFDRSFSVVWAQDSWIHIDEPGKLAAVAASALRPGGTLAFEDVLLRRAPAADAERQWMQELGVAWRSSFSPLQSWCRALQEQGFRITVYEDDTPILLQHYRAATALAAAMPEKYPAHEVTGWSCALSLATAGVIQYSRIVARLDSQAEAAEPPGL